jgi:hypothetical protein
VTCVVSAGYAPVAEPQNTTTALPKEARWSIEHWEAAF